MKQVFTDLPCAVNQAFALDQRQAHHLFDVLRTSPKETVRVISNEEVFLGHAQDKPYIFIFGKEEVQPRLVDVTLCTALIKSDKFEWMLQKAAELGVSRIVPFVSRYSIVQLDDKRALKKLDRWQQILLGACRQCNRNDLVELYPVTSLDGLEEYKSRCNVAAYEKEDVRHLADYLCTNPSSVTAVIGPEGGFSKEEMEKLEAMGFAPVSLGNQILRAETAALYVLAAVEYQTHLKQECTKG